MAAVRVHPQPLRGEGGLGHGHRGRDGRPEVRGRTRHTHRGGPLGALRHRRRCVEDQALQGVGEAVRRRGRAVRPSRDGDGGDGEPAGAGERHGGRAARPEARARLADGTPDQALRHAGRDKGPATRSRPAHRGRPIGGRGSQRRAAAGGGPTDHSPAPASARSEGAGDGQRHRRADGRQAAGRSGGRGHQAGAAER